MTPPAKRAKRRKRRARRARAPQSPPVEVRVDRRRVLRWAAIGLGVVAFSLSIWFFVLFPSQRPAGQGRAVEVLVPPNPSAGELATTLAEAGVIARPRLFALWVRLTGGARGVVAGKHLLTDDATPREVMARLERRMTVGSAKVTFPEGWTRFDMARRLEEKRIVGLREFLDATTDASLLGELGIEGDSAEGFLFPATYDLPLDADPRDVVRRMKHEFDRRWDIASRAHGAALNDVMTSARMSIRDVVTLASMVEKEAVVDDERPTIASVFLNRLRDPAFKPKHLECDPTASYGCLVMPEKAASCVEFTGRATAAIEHDADNPYSTYTHEGLPPGPIANPGARSLEAAMSPSATHFFFFVARGEGRHAFSETFQAHNAAVHAAGARSTLGSR
ncbi:MAG TPA: endolytic transglycosylase MltG [Polyangiaceae bacterium]|nr:endolytic transglycosylase MltG [Polyangiaceae bacterium]